MEPTRLQRLLTPVVGAVLVVVAGATLATGTGIETTAAAVQWVALGGAGILWVATALYRDDPGAWARGFGSGLVLGAIGYAAPAVGAVVRGTTGGGWAIVRILVGAAIVAWGIRYATLGMGRIASGDGPDGESGGDGGGGG